MPLGPNILLMLWRMSIVVILCSSGAKGQVAGQLDAGAPPPAIQGAPTGSRESLAERDGGLVLKRLTDEVAILRTAIDQNQKLDNKLGISVQIMALAAAAVPLLGLLLVVFEYLVRQRNMKANQEFQEEVKREVAGSNKEIRDTIDGVVKHVVDREINKKLEAEIRRDLSRLISEMESEYSRNLARLEFVLFSFLQNECKKRELFGSDAEAMRHLFTFRHLLTQLTAGTHHEIHSSLCRIYVEYVPHLGRTTKFYLSELCRQLSEHPKYLRREISLNIKEIMNRCA